ncbi:hypothetical protein EVAR_33396_1 [Eumeta japonica]|uniref:Uncharacterized protein n=1 Tax=Eumeta variegata TaxID=151549 RepID=A0A4C1W397_EUMVA|nr:hypothetical protein EVAR_33396_1 [Eumeta japonica]
MEIYESILKYCNESFVMEPRCGQPGYKHGNESARPVKYHTLIEYKRDVTASVVVSRPVSESVRGSLPLHLSTPTYQLLYPPLSSSSPSDYYVYYHILFLTMGLDRFSVSSEVAGVYGRR